MENMFQYGEIFEISYILERKMYTVWKKLPEMLKI